VAHKITSHESPIWAGETARPVENVVYHSHSGLQCNVTLLRDRTELHDRQLTWNDAECIEKNTFFLYSLGMMYIKIFQKLATGNCLIGHMPTIIGMIGHMPTTDRSRNIFTRQHWNACSARLIQFYGITVSVGC